MKKHHVVLSGGVGSRLWPVSRKSRPKQYIPMFGEKSLFLLTVERNKNLFDQTIVVGNKENYLLSQAEMAHAGISKFAEIIEASPRDTAAAITFAALSVNEDDILLVTPSDHIILNQNNYQAAINEAITFAENDNIVTLGIIPTKPETGYGYIEYKGNDVLSFREKPTKNIAQSFLVQGNFLWNSGIFCFKAGVYLEELRKFQNSILHSSTNCWNAREGSFLPERETLLIPKQSVDYAVMEKSNKIKVIKADFEWSDLGSFESIWEHWQNVKEEQHFKNNNCIIGSKKHVEFLGVSDIVLVETEDAILVLSKEYSQEVKQIFDRLETENSLLIN